MPSITYNLNTPVAGNDPSVDQPNMTINTNSINTWNDVDHFTFSSSNAGNHKKVAFPDATSPVPTAASTVGVLYAALASGVNQLFFVNSATTYQLTGTSSTNLGSGSFSGTGGGSYSVLTLPMGIRLFMCSAGNASGGRTLTMNNHTFGSTVYASAGAGASAGSAVGFAVAPSSGTANVTINTSASSALTFIVITN